MDRYVVREKELRKFIGYDAIPFKYRAIMREIKLEDGQVIYLPSSLNAVTYNKYRNKPVSTAKNINTTICQFMNYI